MPVFVGPGSAPDGGFEGRSDRVGFPTATADPGSAVVGDMYVQAVGSGSTLKMYTGTEWVAASAGSGPGFDASGGTTSTSDNNKRHVFTSPGNFVVSAGTENVNILVVGGGGGGGASQGNGQSAGAGAGGFRFASSFPISPGTYAITVGSGGNGSGTTPSSSKDGGNSSF